MLTYSLGEGTCPAGQRYDPVEQRCVFTEKSPASTIVPEASVPMTEFAPMTSTTPAAPGVPVTPVTPTTPEAPAAPAAPDVPSPGERVSAPEASSWKWWYWLLLAGGVGGTGALLYYGLRRPASAGLRGSGDERIKIEYGVTKTSKGWKPTYWLNGRNRGSSWYGVFDKDEALKLAKKDARDEASHYSGDWNITVTKRR